jgi:hypothetical protein
VKGGRIDALRLFVEIAEVGRSSATARKHTVATSSVMLALPCTRLCRAKYMEAQLAARDVAASLNLPEVAVQAALTSRGPTFTTLLLDARLKHAAQLLRYAAPEQIKVADLQAGWID